MINSLKQLGFESNAGILVVDNNNRRMVGLNRKFIEIWNFPKKLIVSRCEKLALELASSQLKNPTNFLKEIQEIYIHDSLEVHDTIKLKDGRIFERHTLPQYLEGKNVGRIWLFHDMAEFDREHTYETESSNIIFFPRLSKIN